MESMEDDGIQRGYSGYSPGCCLGLSVSPKKRVWMAGFVYLGVEKPEQKPDRDKQNKMGHG